MVEPGSHTVLVGAGISSLATYLLGPAVGEYAVILGMGLVGTLVALTDEDFHNSEAPTLSWASVIWKAFRFIFRGMALSLAFAGILAYPIADLLPKSYGMTPYAVLSSVAFTIGWTSNKWGSLREKIVNRIGGLFK